MVAPIATALVEAADAGQDQIAHKRRYLYHLARGIDDSVPTRASSSS